MISIISIVSWEMKCGERKKKEEKEKASIEEENQ
jgi:hypothetical protein